MYWLQITSGRGPDECGWVVARLLEYMMDHAGDLNISASVLETVPGEQKGTLKSALIAIEGDGVKEVAREWEGPVLWIGQSMFRSGHKRKNWFVGVRFIESPETVDLNDRQYKIETMRSSGPGGQHVNKTESAVRITHVPTGLSATAREERSQHLNKKLALTRIHDLLKQKETNEHQQAAKDRWDGHNELERGNPVKVFKGFDFREKSSQNTNRMNPKE